METVDVIISDHAFKRWRERNTLTYNISISKLARQGYRKGVNAEAVNAPDFQSYLQRMMSREYFASNQIVKIYKNFVMIFGLVEEGAVLITIFELPNKFGYLKNYAILK